MEKTKINEFSRRINQGNKSEIIVVLFDIFFAYTADARDAFARSDSDAAIEGLRRASQVIEHLKRDLSFTYSISAELYPLYVFAQRALAKSTYKNSAVGIDEAEEIMRPLAEAFEGVAKEDTSATLMKNSESLVAGYTYGRNDVNEVAANYDKNRGFLA